MACTIVDLTLEDVRKSIREKRLTVNLDELSTQEGIINYMDKTSKYFTKVNVPVETLPKSVQKVLIAEPGELVERYGLKGYNDEAALSKRATDSGSLIRSKGREKAKLINTTPDNIIKADSGTSVHNAAQGIMNEMVAADNSGLIIKDDNYKRITLDQIREDNGLSERDFKNLIEGVKKIKDAIVKTQKTIDPNGKVKILTEQFIFDSMSDIGGTIDLVAVYSDATASILDYKTINPARDKVEWDNMVKAYKLKSDDWIPFYKYNDFNNQLSTLKKIVQTRYGIKEIRHSRIVPIHIEFEQKAKRDQKLGERLTGRIAQVSIGKTTTQPFLSQLPIGELTGFEKLDAKINVLMNIKQNLELRLEKMDRSDPKRASLISDINRKQKVINRLIVDKDINALIVDFSVLSNRYHDGMGGLKDIDNQFIDGKPNPTYLSLEELSDLKADFEAYVGILKASGEFLAEMKITDPQIYSNYLAKIKTILGEMSLMGDTLQQKLQERVISESELKSIKDAKSTGWWAKFFRSLGAQNHPVLIRLNKLLQTANNKRRLGEQKVEQEIKDMTLKLEQYASSRGMSLSKVYDMLYNPTTGNLHGKHSVEFYDALKNAQETGDIAWLTKYLKPKDNYEDLLKQDFTSFTNRFDRDKREVENWKKDRSLGEVIKNQSLWRRYYDINVEDTNSTFYSEGYRNLLNPANKPLLDYWNFYTTKMGEALNMLELGYGERLPHNFLPWIRASMVDHIMQDGWNWENISETAGTLFKIKSDETLFGDPLVQGKVDPNTNKPAYDIPKFFINPLFDNKGKIAAGLKSRDLSKSLFTFYSMALNYSYMKTEVEPYVEGLKDVMAVHGSKIIDSKTGKGLAMKSGILAKLRGEGIDDVKLFDMMVNYHLYGVKIQDANRENAKIFMSLKSIQQKKELGFAPLTWAGNFIQVKMNSYFEGLKGYHYTTKQMHETHAMAAGARGKEAKDLYNALIYFLEPSPGRGNIKAKNLGATAIQRYVNWDSAFWGFRAAEESVNNTVMVAVMQNYGLDANGMPKRLSSLPAGTKSLLESSRIEDGELIIEGVREKGKDINIETYTALRNLGLGISRTIKGQMNPEDAPTINMSLLSNLMMGFKNWMPGMLDERIAAVRYDAAKDAVIVGKYVALLKDMSMEERSVGEYLGNVLLPKLGAFLLDVTTFGSVIGHRGAFKASQERSRVLFENFKAEFPNDANVQRMTLQDFVEYRQGQVRSLAAELSIILSFVGALLALGTDWNDDGEPLYKETWGGRTLFRVINRGRREIAFFISPNDWYAFMRTPIPITSLVDDIIRTVGNTLDETGDLLYGEDTEREGIPRIIFGANRGKDKKPAGYETIRWLPGNKLFKAFEIFKAQEEAKF